MSNCAGNSSSRWARKPIALLERGDIISERAGHALGEHAVTQLRAELVGMPGPLVTQIARALETHDPAMSDQDVVERRRQRDIADFRAARAQR